MNIKSKKCKNPECEKEFTPRFNTLEKYCSYKCKKACIKPNEAPAYKKPINKVSPKRAILDRQYAKDRKEFLKRPENMICYIPGCGLRSTTIEHKKGRVGFADEEKRAKNIPLLLDQDYWAGCCWNHNMQLENDPELSKLHQLSKIHQGKKI